MLVETESQKGIVVGKGGGMIRDIGSAARSALGRLWGTEVRLDLTVRVRKRWRDDESMLSPAWVCRPAGDHVRRPPAGAGRPRRPSRPRRPATARYPASATRGARATRAAGDPSAGEEPQQGRDRGARRTAAPSRRPRGATTPSGRPVEAGQEPPALGGLDRHGPRRAPPVERQHDGGAPAAEAAVAVVDRAAVTSRG